VTDETAGGQEAGADSDPRGPGSGPRSGADALIELLAGLAERTAIAGRMLPATTEPLLRSIVEATVTLFDAEAASIALHEAVEDRLVFRVAAGAAGAGAIGVSVKPGEGIAGYVFAAGEPLAIADVGADPRWGRDAAARTGYLPRSILAVPLVDDEGSIGVLEILDRRGGSFGLHDIELATVFARQATVALRAGRLEQDVAAILRSALASFTSADTPSIQETIDLAIERVSHDDGMWRLADAVARVAGGHPDPDRVELVVELLEALERHPGTRAARGRVAARIPFAREGL
jgi:GAF domain-containing protein